MPFYKKTYNKQQRVYYPRAIVQGKLVETETIAKDLAKISTMSNSDVQATRSCGNGNRAKRGNGAQSIPVSCPCP